MDYQFLQNTEVYRELVLGRMLEAKRSLWIASANIKDMHVERAKRFHSVLKDFRKLADRGVDVRVLHSGIPGERYRRSLKDAGLIGAANFTMRWCPRVHFKSVLVDDDWVFLGSPNLTGAGLGAKGEHRRNFEFGILTQDATLRDHVTRLFLDVWEARMCDTCGRKNSCPVPLEEPDF